MGRLVGIARKARPRGPVETVDHVHIGPDTGVTGDHRGIFRPGKRNRRQVTVLAIEDWEAALSDLGTELPWIVRRANLLVEGVALPHYPGPHIRIGDCILEVTGETDPCSRMDEAAPGLRTVLTPAWRGGVTTKVLAGGDVALGDGVQIEE